MSNRIGDLQVVENKNPHFAANEQYNYLRVQLPSGEEVNLLLTENELTRAIARAKKNLEDISKVSWIRNLLD